jgi:transcription initiation factor IIE alpha subunit
MLHSIIVKLLCDLNTSSAFSVQKQEARAPDQRAVPKTYYYIDYKQFVNVVKWKMYKMQTSVRDTLRTVRFWKYQVDTPRTSHIYSHDLL